MKEKQSIEEYEEMLVKVGLIVANGFVRLPDSIQVPDDGEVQHLAISLQKAFSDGLTPEELKESLYSLTTDDKLATVLSSTNNPKDENIHLRVTSVKPDGGIPYYQMLDLYCYPVICVVVDDVRYTVAISKYFLRKWGRTVDSVFNMVVGRQAYRYKSLSSVVKDYTDVDEIPFAKQMYVVQNKDKTFGAVVLFDTQYLEFLRWKIGNYWVLPSSIHEIIIVPVSGHMDTHEMARGLMEIVKEVNRTEIAPNDFLSNSVYLYTEKGLQIAQ